MDVSDIFIFFCGGRGRGSPERGGGGLLKIPGRGGVSTSSENEICVIWEFPNLVVLNLVVCNLYAEALSCTLLRRFAPFCALLPSLALFCGLAFALFCALLRPTALRTNCVSQRTPPY